jgi:hypothetical protein
MNKNTQSIIVAVVIWGALITALCIVMFYFMGLL